MSLYLSILLSLLAGCASRDTGNKNRPIVRTPTGDNNSGPAPQNQGPSGVPSPSGEATPAPTGVAEPRSALSLICAIPPELSKYAPELGSICANGDPTPDFVAALDAPYRGTGTPPLKTLKAQTTGDTIEFVLLAVLEVPVPIAQVVAKRSVLRQGTLSGGGATITKTLVRSTPGDGIKNLGSAEIKQNFRYLVINKTTLFTEDAWVLDAEQNLQAAVTYLKPGAPENAKAKLANAIAFMIGEGTKTKIIYLNHQIEGTSGQPDTVKRIVKAMGLAAMQDAFKKLSPMIQTP